MARPTLILAALAAACALSGIVAATPSAAIAADGLILTSDARYDVRPDAGHIAVTIDAVATNVTPDTATEFFYYTGVTVIVQAGATGFSATSGGIPLQVSAAESTADYVAVDVTFGADLLYQQSIAFQLTFVLSDGGGDPARDILIRESFVAFPVWAFGSPDATNASVEVAWPKGYDVSVPFGTLRQVPTGDGPRQTARAIDDPSAFVAYVTGERDGARTNQELTVAMADGDASLIMMAWTDDPEWLQRQSDVLVVGLPALERAIGLEYPVTGTLSVSEHAYRHLGDYIGLFDPIAATIQMRFDADTFTTLHEAAHVWFNGKLFQDRWILEAFASYYAEVVATELGLEIVPDELTPDLSAAAFPLNDWLAPRFDDDLREAYAYAAAPEVASQIAALAGPEGLRQVWTAADENRLAYAASDDDPRAADDPAPAAWQRLLDLLENATTADYDPIWREWVLAEGTAGQLEEREDARAAYAEAVEAADGWVLPRSTRALMDGWRFADARAELADAHALFADREALARDAGSLQLDATDDLRSAFEQGGLDNATREVREQRAALDAIEAATAELRSPLDVIERVGLIGEDAPSLALERARASFEAGEDDGAVDAARDGIEKRAAAAVRGRERIGIGAGGLLALDLVVMGTLALRRRRPTPQQAIEPPAPA